MRITLHITNPEHEQGDQLVSLDIFPDMPVATLRSSIEAETRIPTTSLHIYHNGQLLMDDTKTMAELSIGDGEMLAVHVRRMRATGPRPGAAGPGRAVAPRGGGEIGRDAESVRLQILGSPELRAQLERVRPQMAAVLDDATRFREMWQQNSARESREQQERQAEIARLNADPFNLEAQAKIADMIRQEQVMDNLQKALEHNPEMFGRVHMLYIDVEVNGHKVKAFVDSGAQATIMSPGCAEACGIMRLVDERFAGIAKGVGTAKIIGRVSLAMIKIGTAHLPCMFTVMEGKSVDLLLGLDMLKRHQACIDLVHNKLVLQADSGPVEVPFLGEADIPKEEEEALYDEPTIPGPHGTQIGTRTGTVTAAGAAGAAGPSSSGPTAGAPGPSPGPPGGPSQPQTHANPHITEEKIAGLISMGFPRERVIRALAATDGNPAHAADLLLLDAGND